MFSSPHSHDAMRRLLKAAVGVPEKAEAAKPKSESIHNRRTGSHRLESYGPAGSGEIESKDVLRT